MKTMKNLLLTIAFSIGLVSMLNAQWVSPGNGTTYTLVDLMRVTEGVVTNTGTVFSINSDLTISENDVLKIDNQVSRIDAGNVLITINGSVVCTNTERVKFYGTLSEHFSIRFENATDCKLKTLYFSDGAGIKVIESDVDFIDCKFVYFTRDYCSSVIDFMNCNPLIENCYFLLNEGAAIGSPANGQGSPQILNCQFDSNVNSSNNPQINLGPGSEDTIFIVGNEIDGTYATWHAGGVSVSDLMGIGATKVVFKDNIIKEGRYGYNQQGQSISSVITNNQFINNNHEDNPMNGGSGISIYGMDENNKAVLRNNIITGNLWGITVINAADVDLGTEDDWGNNEIHDNGNGGVVYDLYNNSTYDIMAIGNNWGTTSEGEVEDHIVHQYDNPSLGLVTFIPFVGYDNVNESKDIAFNVYPNPISDGNFSILLESVMPSEVVIYNVNGQKVKSQHIENKTNTINVELLDSGVYFIELKNIEGKYSKIIIIE
jgi:hypothetical protein